MHKYVILLSITTSNKIKQQQHKSDIHNRERDGCVCIYKETNPLKSIFQASS